LPELYTRHCRALGLGSPGEDPAPRHAYNLLFDDRWFLTVRRLREHCAGFSVNGLGFAGYLLCTENADRDWLQRHGPWRLLAEVAAPAAAGAGEIP
jgi:ATP adenylyltransferase